MTGLMRRVLLGLAVLAMGGGLVILYRSHQAAMANEAGRDAPVVAPSRVAEVDGTALIALDSSERRRVGLRLAAVEPASSRPEERLPGEVVAETERAAVLRAPVSGRFTVPDGAHWPGLGERVHAGRILARVSDARPLSVPIDGVVTRVVAQPGALVEAGQALLEVADYSHPLVRVVWLGQAGGSPARRLSLRPQGSPDLVAAQLVGPAPEADPVTRRPAYLYRAVRAWPGGTPGTPVSAVVPITGATPSEGVLVPDAAVVQWEGLAWTYRREAPGRFERVRVMTTRPVPGGWMTGAPLVPGDSVVVRGAQELLSEEFRARVTVGDESGE